MEAARELNQLDDQLYTEGLGLFEHALGTFGSQVEIDAAAMTRGWEIVEGAESATTPDGDAGADDAARAEQIDARAREIVADTRELLSTELLNASRRAGRLVMYSELLAEARAGMLKAGDKDLEPRARKLDREMISNASGAAGGHENHARRVAAALRALLGRVESTAPTPDSEPDEVVSLESAPFR